MVQRYPLINGKSGEELTLPNSSSVIRLRGLPCPDPHTAQESVGGMEGWEKCFKSNWEPDPGETGMCVAWGLGQEWKLPPPSPGRSWEQWCCSSSGQTEPLHPPRAAGPLPTPHWSSPTDKDEKDVPHLYSGNDRRQSPGTWIGSGDTGGGLPRRYSGEEPTRQCSRHKRHGSIPG